MITILLVCIFFGINARVYLNFDNMNATLEVILPLNLTVISVRFNLHNKTLYYNINKGKVRQINIKNNKRKNKKQLHKIRIEKFSYSMILGSNQDCVKGLYMANAIDYLSELFFNISKKYLEINEFDKFIIPNFKDDTSKIVVNIVISKGILDIIKNIFAKSEKRKYEVKYANW